MTAQGYYIISIFSFVLCGFTALFSLFLFFKLRIRAVLDDLSGKNAERQVEEIRQQNRAFKKRASIFRGELQSYESADEISERTALIRGGMDAIESVATTVLNETTLLVNDVDENATIVLCSEQLEECITVIDVMEIHTQEVITE